jgi:hypothetical protein
MCGCDPFRTMTEAFLLLGMLAKSRLARRISLCLKWYGARGYSTAQRVRRFLATPDLGEVSASKVGSCKRSWEVRVPHYSY